MVPAAGQRRFRVAALDLGIKSNTPRMLAARGIETHVLPATLSLEQVLEGADAAVILTAHPGLDVEHIVSTAPVVVDFRGVTRGIEAPNLVRL